MLWWSLAAERASILACKQKQDKLLTCGQPLSSCKGFGELLCGERRRVFHYPLQSFIKARLSGSSAGTPQNPRQSGSWIPTFCSMFKPWHLQRFGPSCCKKKKQRPLRGCKITSVAIEYSFFVQPCTILSTSYKLHYLSYLLRTPYLILPCHLLAYKRPYHIIWFSIIWHRFTGGSELVGDAPLGVHAPILSCLRSTYFILSYGPPSPSHGGAR